MRIALGVVLVCLSLGCRAKPTIRPPVEDDSPQAQISRLEDRRSLGEGRLAKWATDSGDPAVRARALLALGRLQAPQALGVVIQGLSDRETAPRGAAAFGAGLLALSWPGLSVEQKGRLEDALLAAEASEADPGVKLDLLDALARLATPTSVRRLVERASAPSNEELQGRAALGLGVAARREAKLPMAGIELLSRLLGESKLPLVRYGAAYALAHSKADEAREALAACLGQSSVAGEPEVQALCAKGLGEVGVDSDARALASWLDSATPRVAAEATRALARLSQRCPKEKDAEPEREARKGRDKARLREAGCQSIEALRGLSSRVERLSSGKADGSGQVLLALAQQGLPSRGRPVLEALRGQLVAGAQKATEASVKKDLANLDCRFAATLDRMAGGLDATLGCGAGLIPEAHRLALGLRELAQSPVLVQPAGGAATTSASPSSEGPAPARERGRGRSRSRSKGKKSPPPEKPTSAPVSPGEVASRYLSHASPSVQLAAVELMGESKWQPGVERLRPLLESKDLVLAGASAMALAKLGDKASVSSVARLAELALRHEELAPPVAEALKVLEVKDAVPVLERWLRSPHVSVRDAAAMVLGSFTGERVDAPWVELPVDEKTAEPPKLPEDARLEVVTEKGSFEVKLDVHGAPRTSRNLYGLAKKGFYANQTFHRVVPDFVVQGGDPRGDGEGGPGYSIRCEINRRRYVRGTVGMALSGKDTGGSQFFVALSSQPHLDGRYTAFGEVSRGIEVVEALLEGDKILELRALP